MWTTPVRTGKAHLSLFVLLLWLLVFQAVKADPLEKAVSRLERLYKAGGPSVGCLLYEPSLVLAFADLRPEGSWVGQPIRPEEVEKVEELSRLAEAFGCSIETYDGQLAVRSLAGLELTSLETNFPWAASPYLSETGWAGWHDWFRVTAQNANRVELPRLDHYVEGLRLGYPDTAILGYIGENRDSVRQLRSISVDIPFADFLSSGEPNFQVMPEDVLAEDVSRVVDRWGELLSRFYSDPRVKRRITSPEFLRARGEKRTEFVNGRNEMWIRQEYLSDRRLFDPRREGGPTRNDELTLISALGEVESAILKGEPPFEWVRILQREALLQNRGAWITAEVLRDWIWFGGLGESPYRAQLFAQVNAESPALVIALLRQKVQKLRSLDPESDTYRGEAQTLLRNRANLIYSDHLDQDEREFMDALSRDAKSW